MDVLIVAIEAGRWGPPRLPKALKQAGLTVAALCPDDNALAATDFLDRHVSLPVTRSARQMATALAAAIETCQPSLVIPADEQVVALLHYLVRRGPARPMTAAALALITRSLGPVSQFNAMLLKSDTLDLARRQNVLVPPGGRVTSADAAAAMAQRIGYPVFVKASFGWSGLGVTRCTSEAAVRAAVTPPQGLLKSLKDGLKAVVRKILHRDWYPAAAGMDVQGAINGRPSFYCALAWEGRMLAGFAGIPTATAPDNGPSIAVRLGPHEAMAKASEAMIAGLGASGFIGFDFMLEDDTGTAWLLECNPRPVQVCHLGGRIGADLCATLANALAGRAADTPPLVPTSFLEVALFPHALTLPETPGVERDIPWDDAGLRRFAGDTTAVAA